MSMERKARLFFDFDAEELSSTDVDEQARQQIEDAFNPVQHAHVEIIHAFEEQEIYEVLLSVESQHVDTLLVENLQTLFYHAFNSGLQSEHNLDYVQLIE